MKTCGMSVRWLNSWVGMSYIVGKTW